MFSKLIQSRPSKPTKRKRHLKQQQQQQQEQRICQQTREEPPSSSPITRATATTCKKLIRTVASPTNRTISQLISLLGGPLALVYYLLSMSMFYQVMGAGIRCPKIKKHVGIKLRPLNKAKDPFVPNDMLLYTCESEDFTQTIKCLDDGRWSEHPHCPDPSNNTCPDLGPMQHGTYNSSGGPLKVGTALAFRCENEILPAGMMAPFLNQQQQQQMTTPATTTTATTTKVDPIPQNNTMFPLELNNTNSETNPLRYNLTGHRVLKCLPSSKWNHPMPTCTPFYPEPPSNIAFLLTSAALIMIPLLILITVFHLVMRWRKRKQQQERWKQYFTDYKYRHSKTSITFGQRPGSQPQAVTIPVTDL